MSEKIFQESGELENILARVSGQLRCQLERLCLALKELAPPDRRDADPALDEGAALLCQSYYRLLRLAGNLAGLGREAQLADGDVVELVRTVVENVQMPAELLGVRLDFQCSRPSHITAMDRGLLERLLLNLLSNAFRFTPKGGVVTLDVRVEGEWTRLTVSDTGPGLGSTIFDRCFRGQHLAPPPHALGLGLPICREIARQHGGSLVLSSQESGGTKAILSLPNRRADGGGASLYRVDLNGGYDRTLVELADALPKQAFLQRFLD